jgi:hypothetical protein
MGCTEKYEKYLQKAATEVQKAILIIGLALEERGNKFPIPVEFPGCEGEYDLIGFGFCGTDFTFHLQKGPLGSVLEISSLLPSGGNYLCLLADYFTTHREVQK